jgi:hypothetical protein
MGKSNEWEVLFDIQRVKIFLKHFYRGDWLMITHSRVLLILGFFAVSFAAVGVQAGVIAIPDASFETPDLSATPLPYTSDPTGADLAPWSGAAAAIYNVAAYAIPYGEGNVTNPLGAQCGYLGNQVPQRPYLYQTLADTYKAGSIYTLTVGAALYQGGAVAIDPNQSMCIQLGYWTGTPDGGVGPTIVAERQIALGELLEGTLQDFDVTTSAISGDAVGQPIVVYMARTAGAPIGRQYILDDVHLVEVPEPGTIALLSFGLIGLVAFAWRKR